MSMYADVNPGLVNAVVGANEGLAKSYQDRGNALSKGIAGLGNQVVDDVHTAKVKNWIAARGGDPRAVDGGVESAKAEVERLNEIDKMKLQQQMGDDPASLAKYNKTTPTFGEQQGADVSKALGTAYSMPVKGTAEDTAGIPGDTFPTSRPPTDEEAQRRVFASGLAPATTYATLQGQDQRADTAAAVQESRSGDNIARILGRHEDVVTTESGKSARQTERIDAKEEEQARALGFDPDDPKSVADYMAMKKSMSAAKIADLVDRATNRDATTKERGRHNLVEEGFQGRGMNVKEGLAQSIEAFRSGKIAEMPRADQRAAAMTVIESARTLLPDLEKRLKAANSLVSPDPAAATQIKQQIDDLNKAVQQAQGIGAAQIGDAMKIPAPAPQDGRLRGPASAPNPLALNPSPNALPSPGSAPADAGAAPAHPSGLAPELVQAATANGFVWDDNAKGWVEKPK